MADENKEPTLAQKLGPIIFPEKKSKFEKFNIFEFNANLTAKESVICLNVETEIRRTRPFFHKITNSFDIDFLLEEFPLDFVMLSEHGISRKGYSEIKSLGIIELAKSALTNNLLKKMGKK